MPRIFYYCHTGHRIGLDRFHRAAAIINALPELDITLLTSDYRIAQQAHKFGIKRTVGIDVIRNIPQIADPNDILIFDSDEGSPSMITEMCRFASTFIRITDNPEAELISDEYMINPYLKEARVCNAVAIGADYFNQEEKTRENSFFFGDDDYEEDLLKHIETLDSKSLDLLIGFYFFIDYEDKLKEHFKNTIEVDEYPDEYFEVIKESNYGEKVEVEHLLEKSGT